MRKLLYLLILFLVTLIIFSILAKPDAFFLNISSTLNLWFTKVYPSVFTFYTISALLLNTNIINKIIYKLRYIFKRLKFKDQITLNLFILSIFIGNPSSSGLIVESLDKNNLSKSEANNLLKFSAFTNPLFIFAFIFPFSFKYALIIIFVHILSNIIITLYANRKNAHTTIKDLSLKFSFKDILDSINNVIYLLLLISSMMVLANIIIFSINSLFDLLNLDYFFISLILTQFEINRGLNTILSLDINKLIIYLLVCFTVSFNGLSIHLQVINIIGKYNLNYYKFMIFRIIQGVISMGLFLLIYLIEKSLI